MLRFLCIILNIGILAHFILLNPQDLVAGTRRPVHRERWWPLAEDIDMMLLRNQPHHLIEGYGGAGMLLGETETELRLKYGEPAYRDHAAPESVYYTEENVNASFVLRNGRITEIRLEVEKHKSPSVEWFTALGLRESVLRQKTPEEAEAIVSRFYKTKRVRRVANTVTVLSRGIRFEFRGKNVIRVTVTVPQSYADAEN
jgi:hypothetical protein